MKTQDDNYNLFFVMLENVFKEAGAKKGIIIRMKLIFDMLAPVKKRKTKNESHDKDVRLMVRRLKYRIAFHTRRMNTMIIRKILKVIGNKIQYEKLNSENEKPKMKNKR